MNYNVDDFNPWAAMLQHHLERQAIEPEGLAELIDADAADIHMWLSDITIPDEDIVEQLTLALNLMEIQANVFKRAWIVTHNIFQEKTKFSL